MGTYTETVKNSWLNALARNTSYANTAVYVQLHTGAPGGAGTANVSTETDRMQATFGDAAASGAITNTAAVEWTSIGVSGAEALTHVSLWTASSGGTYLGSDDLSSPANVNPGDTFRIPIGDLDLTVSDS